MQLLIYETAVPVSSVHHAKACVEVGTDYRFSGKVNSVPLMAVEFPFAAAEYAIIFAGGGDVPMPAVILGIRDKENLFLNKEGNWQAKYVPAFLRRYPFVFSTNDDGKTFTLCIDETYSGFNREGRGQPLFNEEGKPSAFTDNVLKFVQEYQRQFELTKSFCKKLVELNLLESMQAQVSLPGGETTSLTGFMAVDRKRLKGLSGEKLAELAATDELELLYLHLYSMRNFSEMKTRLEGVVAAASSTT
jgi:hypothetical protein